jgi:hypothetical protein
MRRTDALTAFLSGGSLLILGPALLMLVLQWWVIVLIAVAITGFAFWATLKNSKNVTPTPSKSTRFQNPGLAPEVVAAVTQTLADSYCSRCGNKFVEHAYSYCPACGEARSFKPISSLIDVDTE